MSSELYSFDWKRAAEADDELLRECSALFSAHYGKWGKGGPRPGAPIKLKPEKLRAEHLPPSGWVSQARLDGVLVGYAFGARLTIESGRTVVWVTQLVVHEAHRRHRIAAHLLFNFWQVSDDFAWGLVTSNPYAVRALERATHRRCDPATIRKQAGTLRAAAESVGYVSQRRLRLDDERSIVDTEFFVDHSNVEKKLENVTAGGVPWVLGRDLGEGEEWFAFTLRGQPMFPYEPEEVERMLTDADRTARFAYERMNLDEKHAWARHGAHEVDVALQALALEPGHVVFDVGCGLGRHALELGGRGREVVGVDFVEAFVQRARERALQAGLSGVSFVHGDMRTLELGRRFDGALCLYDVIGSFPDAHDNQAILDTIVKHLRPGARLLGSVMNLELTRKKAKLTANVRRDPSSLQRLFAGDVMQSTGNVFDPDKFLLDPDEGVVYRREKFLGGDVPPSELIVRDRRYTRDDVRAMCERAGLTLLWVRPVRIGAWGEALDPLDDRAKELLFLAQKPLAHSSTTLRSSYARTYAGDSALRLIEPYGAADLRAAPAVGSALVRGGRSRVENGPGGFEQRGGRVVRAQAAVDDEGAGLVGEALGLLARARGLAAEELGAAVGRAVLPAHAEGGAFADEAEVGLEIFVEGARRLGDGPRRLGAVRHRSRSGARAARRPSP